MDRLNVNSTPGTKQLFCEFSFTPCPSSTMRTASQGGVLESMLASANDEELGSSKYFGFHRSVIVETDRPWLFAFRVVAAISILVFVMLDFVAVMNTVSRPSGWFFKLSSWTSIACTAFFILAIFHSIPMASLSKAADGPNALMTNMERAQIMLFAIAWPFALVSMLLFFSSTDAQLGRDPRIIHPSDVGLQFCVHLLPATFLMVELCFTKIVLQHTHLVVLVPLTLFLSILLLIYLYNVTDPYTKQSTPPSVSQWLLLFGANVSIVAAFYIAYFATYLRYRGRINEFHAQVDRTGFARVANEDDDVDAVVARQGAAAVAAPAPPSAFVIVDPEEPVSESQEDAAAAAAELFKSVPAAPSSRPPSRLPSYKPGSMAGLAVASSRVNSNSVSSPSAVPAPAAASSAAVSAAGSVVASRAASIASSVASDDLDDGPRRQPLPRRQMMMKKTAASARAGQF